MSWVFHKLDTLLGGAVIGAGGVAASQAQAFMIQYIQRLGGHFDEAKLHLNNVQHGLRYQLMSETVRKELEAEAQRRVAALQNAYEAIVEANVFARPFAFLRHADTGMIAATWRDFVPSLPASTGSIAYIVAGMLLGFLAYEIVKLPVTTLLVEPRRRKFRKRG